MMGITAKNTRILRRQKSLQLFKQICCVSTRTQTGKMYEIL